MSSSKDCCGLNKLMCKVVKIILLCKYEYYIINNDPIKNKDKNFLYFPQMEPYYTIYVLCQCSTI